MNLEKAIAQKIEDRFDPHFDLPESMPIVFWDSINRFEEHGKSTATKYAESWWYCVRSGLGSLFLSHVGWNWKNTFLDVSDFLNDPHTDHRGLTLEGFLSDQIINFAHIMHFMREYNAGMAVWIDERGDPMQAKDWVKVQFSLGYMSFDEDGGMGFGE